MHFCTSNIKDSAGYSTVLSDSDDNLSYFFINEGEVELTLLGTA